MMRLSDFDYDLPNELIAQFPVKERDGSKLLFLDKEDSSCKHYKFSNLPQLLNRGDLLVLNDTRVVNARLMGKRARLDGKIEILIIDKLENDTYSCLVRPARKFKDGTRLIFGGGELEAEVVGAEGDFKRIRFYSEDDVLTAIEKAGQVPLPPYIKRAPEKEDEDRYQTVYSSKKGAVAAPTAGLHFTRALLSEIAKRGIEIAYITLHVGYATFKPVTEDDISNHKMHREYFEITEESALRINSARADNRRIVAVGTTCCRALESAAVIQEATCSVRATKEWTDLFIRPGYSFKIVDGMITNFHFPRTTLLMLVSALCGRDNLIKAYHEAVEKKYRFYSYGDAMLIL